MQLKLSFLETHPEDRAELVWAALDDEQRSQVVTTLARLIAKTASPQDEAGADAEEERDDE